MKKDKTSLRPEERERRAAQRKFNARYGPTLVVPGMGKKHWRRPPRPVAQPRAEAEDGVE